MTTTVAVALTFAISTHYTTVPSPAKRNLEMSDSESLAVDRLSSTIRDPRVATSRNIGPGPELRSSGQSDSVQGTEAKSPCKRRNTRSAHLQPPPNRALGWLTLNGSTVCTQDNPVSGYITKLNGAMDTSNISEELQSSLRGANPTSRPTPRPATTCARARIDKQQQQKKGSGEQGVDIKDADVLQRDQPSSSAHPERLLVELNDQPYSDASPPTRASGNAHDRDIGHPLQLSQAAIEDILSEISVQHMYQRQLVMPTMSTLKSSWYRWAFGSRAAAGY